MTQLSKISILLLILTTIGSGNATSDSTKMYDNLLGRFNSIQQNPDSIIDLSKTTLKSFKPNNKFFKAQSYRLIGTCYYVKQDLETALAYLDSSIYFLNSNYKVAAAKSLAFKAVILLMQSKGAEAEISFQKALKLALEANDTYTIAYVKKEIARYYFKYEQFEKTFNMAHSCKDYYASSENPNRSDYFTILNFMAISKLEIDSLNAKPYLDEALKVAQEVNNPILMVIANANIASYLSKTNQHQASLEKNLECLKVFEKENHVDNLIANYINLGYNYLSLNRLDEAAIYLEKGISLAEENQALSFAKKGYHSLIKVFKRLGKAEEAHKAQINYLKKVIELTKKNNSNTIANIILKNEIKNETIKNRILELEVQQKEDKIKRQSTYLILISITLILVIILIFILYKYSKKLSIKQNELTESHKQVQLLNDRKDKIIAILSHDLRAPLTQITTLQGILLDKSISKIEFDKMQTKLHFNSINSLLALEGILQLAKTFEQESIPVNQMALKSLVADIKKFFFIAIEDKKIEFLNRCSLDVNITSNEEIIKIIIRNIISNAIKFTPEYGKIEITCFTTSTHFELRIMDSGKGFPEKTILLINAKSKVNNEVSSAVGTFGEKGSGLGLMLCKDIATSLNIDLKIEKSGLNGSTVLLRIPLS